MQIALAEGFRRILGEVVAAGGAAPAGACRQWKRASSFDATLEAAARLGLVRVGAAPDKVSPDLRFRSPEDWRPVTLTAAGLTAYLTGSVTLDRPTDPARALEPGVLAALAARTAGDLLAMADQLTGGRLASRAFEKVRAESAPGRGSAAGKG